MIGVANHCASLDGIILRMERQSDTMVIGTSTRSQRGILVLSTPNTTLPTPVASSHRTLLVAVLGGLGLAAVLTLIALLRYPESSQQLPATIIFAGGALGVLLVLAAWVIVRGTRPQTPEANRALQIGSRIGLIGGVLWVIEISFNNILPPEISVPHRDTVDNIFWLAIVLLQLVAAILGAAQTKRFTTGVIVGLWGGFISGLMACLAGLALVVFGIDLLLRDPLAQAEYALRGSASGAPDMATYVARDTTAGAFGHLVLLGIIAGLLLGVLGGGIGRLLSRRTPGIQYALETSHDKL